MAQNQILKVVTDNYDIILPDKQQENIRILQITDLHLGNKRAWKADMLTFRRVEWLIEQTKPDIIAITGDLFTGEKPDGHVLAMAAVNFFDQYDIPYFYIFGNHDPEGNIGREPFRQVFDVSHNGLLGYHMDRDSSVKHDYKITVKINDTPVWNLFAFDSGSEKGFKSIKTDQLEWFKKTSLQDDKKYGREIPATAFLHIPLKQYQDLWYDDSIPKNGILHEKVCYEEDDGSVYDFFLKHGHIRACFCGHDHDNNYNGIYKGGILLAYGHVTGESGYHRHWPPGGTLITLPLDGEKIQINEFIPDIDISVFEDK